MFLTYYMYYCENPFEPRSSWRSGSGVELNSHYTLTCYPHTLAIPRVLGSRTQKGPKTPFPMAEDIWSGSSVNLTSQ